MKPDVIVCWPRNCDYPLWRRFIRDERARFARIFVMFTEHDGPVDYSPWIREQIGDIAECFNSAPTQGRDWRDVAVNAALDRSTAEWVWFTEQDFFIRDPTWFFGLVARAIEHGADVVGIRDETVAQRSWHPASLFVRRATVERTSRYFGPEPVDHFTAFGRELDTLGSVGVENYWLCCPGKDWEHLQGLSQNHYLVDRGIDPGVFNRPRFREYLAECLDSGVPLDPRWAERAQWEIGLVMA